MGELERVQMPTLGQDAPTAVIYCDGGCEPNPGPGGWACIVLTPERVIEAAGPVLDTTSVRMEMDAALQGLQRLEHPSRVTVVTDSKFLISSMTKWISNWSKQGWKKGKKGKGGDVLNADLWQDLAKAALKHETSWAWTRGHAGDPLNERADTLANSMVLEADVETTDLVLHDEELANDQPLPEINGAPTLPVWLSPGWDQDLEEGRFLSEDHRVEVSRPRRRPPTRSKAGPRASSGRQPSTPGPQLQSVAGGRIRVGTSGWSYPDWKRAGFYPKGSKAGDFLSYYAQHFDTVEVDGSYYRSPGRDLCERWADATPEGFIFSLKMPKLVVHGGEARDRNLVDENVWNWEKVGQKAEQFLDATGALGAKRGPILLQCPRYPQRIYADWESFLEVVTNFLEKIPEPQYVLEIRNGNWIEPQFLEALRSLKLSLVMADFRESGGGDKKTFPRAADFISNPLGFVTGPVSYTRLIGDRYKIEAVTKTWDKVVVGRSTELEEWAKALMGVAAQTKLDIYAYANNHFAGHGPQTACEMIASLNEIG